MINDIVGFDILTPRMEQVRIICKELQEYPENSFERVILQQAIIMLMDSCAIDQLDLFDPKERINH